MTILTLQCLMTAYAGTHSTDNGGNTNWVFTAAPAIGGVGKNLAIGMSMSIN